MESFLQTDKRLRIVPGSGPRDAKIVIIGEAPGSYESAQLKPFVGPAGGVLEQCLHAAGLIRSEIYVTNVVKVQPPGNDISPYFSSTKGIFTSDGREWVEFLHEELRELRPNVVVACGATAFAATTGLSRILKLRGYVFEPLEGVNVKKVVPTIHPSAALRGQYLYRHLIAADLKKAKAESEFPELRRPQRQLVYDFTDLAECLEWLAYFEAAPIVGFDIEVVNYELACISFSDNPTRAISIPLTKTWTLEEEAQVWLGIQRVLGNPKSIKVVQNSIFDIQFLLMKCGIAVRGPIHDTMIAHSIQYPELRKGLDFLGSLYCGSQEYWKSMVKFDNIKEES